MSKFKVDLPRELLISKLMKSLDCEDVETKDSGDFVLIYPSKMKALKSVKNLMGNSGKEKMKKVFSDIRAEREK